jgi:hypothetical protein
MENQRKPITLLSLFLLLFPWARMLNDLGISERGFWRGVLTGFLPALSFVSIVHATFTDALIWNDDHVELGAMKAMAMQFEIPC